MSMNTSSTLKDFKVEAFKKYDMTNEKQKASIKFFLEKRDDLRRLPTPKLGRQCAQERRHHLHGVSPFWKAELLQSRVGTRMLPKAFSKKAEAFVLRSALFKHNFRSRTEKKNTRC